MSAPTKERSDAHLTEGNGAPRMRHLLADQTSGDSLVALCGYRATRRIRAKISTVDCVVCFEMWKAQR